MGDSSNGNGRDEFSVSGMGFSGMLKGKEVITTIVFIVFSIGLGVLYAQHTSESTRLDVIIRQMQVANELSYLQTYTLSRPQNERVPIMPPAQLWKYLDQEALREREEARRK